MKKKAIVCGCSFMSPVLGKYAKTHFTEILSKKMGIDMEFYSRMGISNFGIVLQIEDAINNYPDLILLDFTTFDRLDIPICGTKFQPDPFKFTIQDIAYNSQFATSLSCNNPKFNKDPKIISEPIGQLLDGIAISPSIDEIYQVLLKGKSNDIKNSIRSYMTDLYHPNIKQQTDRWIIECMLHKLKKSNIPFLIVFDLLGVKCPWDHNQRWNYDICVNNITSHTIKIFDNWSKELELETKRLSGLPADFDWLSITKDYWEKLVKEKRLQVADPGYHSLPERQIELADFVLTHLKNNNDYFSIY